jgi:uncharacterized protein (UPF0262 family)
VIQAIRIDDALWDAASSLRRDDWRISITDLVDEAALGEEDDHLLVVSIGEDVIALTTFDSEGAPRGLFEVSTVLLRVHVEEYLAIITRMHKSDASDASTHMHTLDMAKKVVHDAGARTLARELPAFARDHESYRRLFTLVLSVVVDVTVLPGAAAHRRHG